MVDCCELLHALAQTEHRAECVTIVYIHMSDRRTESSMFLFCFFFFTRRLLPIYNCKFMTVQIGECVRCFLGEAIFFTSTKID